MEKNSSVILTKDDLAQYDRGLVSDRLVQTWGFTFSELKNIVESGAYKLVEEE